MNHADFYPTNNESINKILSQLVDLNQLISNEDKNNFIKYIFYGNLKDYQRTINMLNLMNNWKLAHKMLSLVFSEKNINENGKHAARLSNIVFSRYYPV